MVSQTFLKPFSNLKALLYLPYLSFLLFPSSFQLSSFVLEQQSTPFQAVLVAPGFLDIAIPESVV